MAYKNTPLTGLSVKQIQILIEARNRPGVHTYYPGGHNVLITTYFNCIQRKLVDMQATLFVERTDTLVPVIISMWKHEGAFYRITPKLVVNISNVLKIYVHLAIKNYTAGDMILQRTFSKKVIFQVVGKVKALKLSFDGEDVHELTYKRFRGLENYTDVTGNAAIYNPIIFHEYHFETTFYLLEEKYLIYQDEYFAAGCNMYLDLAASRLNVASILIDNKETTPKQNRIEYNLRFFLVGLLVQNRQTKQKAFFTPIVTPIRADKFAMSNRYFAHDLTATLVTL